ncbi:zinc-binding alcohol dehydrogenase family protein [Kitasatospora sp. NBC_01287]|uniref:quinone oxidoreductase family protein n=1 Tax=Kitasatospora sp. NBC_01287 TaxID=2903573 RepID=UPI0022520DEF|nr:zinc-binding alcohol dehydrogenase family protein [Kitasatospora sp. NBC_01287]MCX4751099.1 zinc-binding alcohol dehydrogenase family protein [Kitasatospora sp. NBC_01287]
MRAAIVNQLGRPPHLGERPDPVERPGHTLVRVTAAALNPVDLHIAAGSHPAGAPTVPFVPGVEGAGTVVSGGSLPAGTRVRVAVPGGLVDGTLAELVSVPDGACLPLPPGLDDDLAAAVGVVGVSALLALRTEAGLRPGESVLVLGATGGLGQALVHTARALGAGRVAAAGRDPHRLGALGAAADTVLVLDPDSADADPGRLAAQVSAIGGPVDVVVDLLWGPHARLAQAALRPGGRWVNLGQTAGGRAELDAAVLRHGHLRLRGFSAAALPPEQVAAGYRETAALAASGALPLAVTTRPLAEVAEAWAAQAASPGAKLVLRP